jgi:hypothetical protein
METSQAMPMQGTPGASGREPRSLGAGAGASWWGEGWRIFSVSPGMWIAILIVFVIITVVLQIIPLVGGLVHALLMPVFTGGVMLGCHALARGEPLRFGHLFAGFQGGHFGPLIVLGLILLGIGIVYLIVIGIVAVLTVGTGIFAIVASGGNDPTQVANVMGKMGTGLFVLSVVAFILAILVGMAYWLAPALVAVDGVAPMTAVGMSFRGSARNFGAFIVYVLCYVGLAIVASIPFGLGWLVLGPMLVGSAYAARRTIYGD